MMKKRKNLLEMISHSTINRVICFSVFFALIFFSCKNTGETANLNHVDLQGVDQIVDSVHEKAMIIETVINLPDVIKKSKAKYAKENGIQYYIYEEELSKGSTYEVKQLLRIIPIVDIKNDMYYEEIEHFDNKGLVKDKEIKFKVPCYNFESIELTNGNAHVKMYFNNGMFAIGNLKKSYDEWLISEDFKIGLR